MHRSAAPSAISHALARVLARLAAPALVLTLVAASVTLLAARGFAVVQHCVPAPGAWGFVGTHLALVREAPECPAGTAALGGDPASVATVLGVLALPVLLGHGAALLAGWGVSAYLRRAHVRVHGLAAGAARAAATLLRRLLGGVPALVRTAPRVATPLPGTVARRLHGVLVAARPTLRGPPVRLAA